MPPPAPTENLGQFTTMAVRPDGRRVIATWDATQTNLVLLLEDDTGRLNSQVVAGWAVQEGQVQDTDSGRWASLALDDQESIHLAWYDGKEQALMYGLLKPGSPFEVTVVDGEGNRGTHTSLVAEDNGAVHIAYRDEGMKSLRYAHRDGNGIWTTEAVPPCAPAANCLAETDDYGEHADIVEIGGLARIVFYDRALGDLKLAAQEGSGDWTVLTLDGRNADTGVDEGDVGRFACIALDSKLRVGVAYYDHTRGALRYLPADGASNPVVVDDGLYWDAETGARRNHPVGQHVHLRFANSGAAHMMYLDGGQLGIKRAVVTGATVLGSYTLGDLAPGGYIGFEIHEQNQIIGAYGAWGQTGSLNTHLERFTIEVKPE